MQENKILLPKNTSDVHTPWLWIGTWSMGGEGFGRHDERESLKTLHRAVRHNIRHFDTAGFYAHGKSERMLRKIIWKDREKFFISSKGGLVWNGSKVAHKASARDLREQLFQSLDRLGTDYIDLYQLHWPDPDVPLKENIEALKGLQESGLIRYWGAGNLNERQIKDNLSGERNVPHQVHFNPIHKNVGALKAGGDICINCVVSPLEQGLLGRGKSSLGTAGIGKKDIRNRNPFFSRREVLEWNGRLDQLCSASDVPKVIAVLLWICTRPHVHVIVPGPRNPGQLDDILHFRSIAEECCLPGDDPADSILSEKRVKTNVPSAVWRHLCREV